MEGLVGKLFQGMSKESWEMWKGFAGSRGCQTEDEDGALAVQLHVDDALVPGTKRPEQLIMY